ncbi:MAG TPA: hypothetical protein VN784_02270 [Candidatus Limnocylindrales bacterium]|nr:hypothetical protein [Candidatus Limnocylindrales bacterium]
MRMRIVVIIMLIISIGVFLVACQKKPMEKAFSNAFQQTLKKVFGEKLHAAESNHIQHIQISSISTNKAATSPLNRKNLGVLPLSNHVSTTVPLDRNTHCTLTPTLLQSGNVQIILTMETTGADGKPAGMNVARVLAHPGEPFDVSIDNMDLAFTPQIADP